MQHSVEFGALSPEGAMRPVTTCGMAILLAYQIAYGAFFRSVLEVAFRLRRRDGLCSKPVRDRPRRLMDMKFVILICWHLTAPAVRIRRCFG
jgi:hypothetical protein